MSEWFQTDGGKRVRAVTADKMRAVDRVAVAEVGLQLLQMMENAGRALAWHSAPSQTVQPSTRIER